MTLLNPGAHQRRHELFAFLLILAVTLLVRLPFFFTAVIDWDESTFILLGQSILDGHLPYTHVWDVKAPLLFAFFAGAIAAGGHTVEGIRIAGSLCVAVASWLSYDIAKRWWSGRAAGWFAALLCVLMSSLIESGQATMSEHVMLPALMGTAWLWIRAPHSTRTSFWSGVLMAVAVLVRLNMAYAAIAFGIALTVHALRSARSPIRAVSAFVLGGSTVVLIVCLPFAFAGELPLFWKSAVVAPLARADNGELASRIADLYAAALRPAGEVVTENDRLWLAILFWPAALAGLLIAWIRPKVTASFEATILISLLIAGTVVGIVRSGAGFGHYLIQLVPLAAVSAAGLACHPSRFFRRVIWAAVIVLTVLSLKPVLAAYNDTITRVASGRPLRHGPAYDIAAYLERENRQRRPVLLLSDHLAYWLTRSEPPNPFVTHPSTLSRPAVLAVMGTTPARELEAIFRHPPDFVVLDPADPVLNDPERKWLDDALRRNYVPAAEVSGRQVFKRRSD